MPHLVQQSTSSVSMVAPSQVVMDGDALKILREHVHKEYERQDCTNGWRSLPEIPAAEEINTTFRASQANEEDGDSDAYFLPLDLPHNNRRGPWTDIETYVRSHYQLIRQDAIAGLRQAVYLYKMDPTMADRGDVHIYTHVYIVGMTSSTQGLSPRIEFSTERAAKRIRWAQSKRLQQGTVVALSPVSDKFKTICKIAVVAARPMANLELNPPQIDIMWANYEEFEFDPFIEYVMVESRLGYFEAYRHMLVAMQKLVTERFPLSEHLVGLERAIKNADFVTQQPFRNLDSLNSPGNHVVPRSEARFNDVNIVEPWPQMSNPILDDSQMAAANRILTKQLAIVQGPPGTGKTKTSITALEVMLKHMDLHDAPIIVAAQTNHALDQLLTLLAPVESNFMRLGGRTRSDNTLIKSRTPYELRHKAFAEGCSQRGNIRQVKRQFEMVAESIQDNLERTVRQGKDEAGLLLKYGIITEEQHASLYDESWVTADDSGLPAGVVALWLGEDQITKPPCCPPVNCFLQEEEADEEYEDLGELEGEMGSNQDDDLDMLRGRYYPIKETYAGRLNQSWSEKRIEKELASKTNLYDIAPSHRGQVYRYFRQLLKDKVLREIRGQLQVYKRNTNEFKIARWVEDHKVVKRSGIRVIGCTTTGLSKYRGFLASFQPRVLFIEEAAETLEGTILAAMFDSLQQLVLVGDHQQLQAQCNIPELSKEPYNLSVSLFERLVNNGLEYTMLDRQRRMVPEIREILKGFYPDLKDHHSVQDRLVNRPPVPGMATNLFWFQHRFPEKRDDSMSRYNVTEAMMIAKFANYLILNGVDPAKITVLTFYNGQRKRIISELKQLPDVARYGRFQNVYTVDSYQGEENDIILLSLVRSNAELSVGFLENKNRAVVSLSRARRGLYIFGDAWTILGASIPCFNIWHLVTDSLCQKRWMGGGLPIVCKTHGTRVFMRDPYDWAETSGGCLRKCSAQLPCGHPCTLYCHPFPHEDVNCAAPCNRPLPCGHVCTQACFEVCVCDRCDNSMGAVAAEASDDVWERGLEEILRDLSEDRTQTRPSAETAPSAGFQFAPTRATRPVVCSRGNAATEPSADSQPAPTPATQPTIRRLDQLPASRQQPGPSVSQRSSPSKWKAWDAKEADRAHSSSTSTDSLPLIPRDTPGQLTIRDVHVPVVLENGVRIRQADATTRIIEHNSGTHIGRHEPTMNTSAATEELMAVEEADTLHPSSAEPQSERLLDPTTAIVAPSMPAFTPPEPVSLSNVSEALMAVDAADSLHPSIAGPPAAELVVRMEAAPPMPNNLAPVPHNAVSDAPNLTSLVDVTVEQTTQDTPPGDGLPVAAERVGAQLPVVTSSISSEETVCDAGELTRSKESSDDEDLISFD